MRYIHAILYKNIDIFLPASKLAAAAEAADSQHGLHLKQQMLLELSLDSN